MALPLTVKTETDIVLQLQCLPSTPTDQEIGDLQREADLPTRIGNLEVRREDEKMTMRTDLGIHEDLRFITKTAHKITSAAHEFLTRT